MWCVPSRGSPEWFKARRGGITGTDLPKILGLTKYGNALTVWRDKRGELPDEQEMEAARWGHILEAPVADEWARRESTRVQPIGVVANNVDTWMRASLDRTVGICPDSEGVNVCGLEVKTRSAYVAGNFKQDIPDDVLAQVQWGLRVTGLKHMHVAVLIGGQNLRTFRVNRDTELEAYLVKEARAMWEKTKEDTPPFRPADSDGLLLRTLNQMFTKREGEVELPNRERAIELHKRYGIANLTQNAAKDTKKRTAGELVQMIGGKEVGLVDGQPLFTYRRPQESDEIKAAELERLSKECPELYAGLKDKGYITRTASSPRFHLCKWSEE